jgi:hypothetical protein
MKVFIPISDEMLEQGSFPDELLAYQPGMVLLSQAQTAPDQSSSTVKRSPTPTPNSDAVPALSSSTYLAGASLG